MIAVTPKKLRRRFAPLSLAVGAALCAVAWPMACAQAAPEKAQIVASPDSHLRVAKGGTRTALDDYIARPEPAYH